MYNKKVGLIHFLKKFITLCACVCTHKVQVEVRGQLRVACSLLPLLQGLWELSSGQ